MPQPDIRLGPFQFISKAFEDGRHHMIFALLIAYQAIATFDGAGRFSLSAFTEVQNGVVLVANASASGGTRFAARSRFRKAEFSCSRISAISATTSTPCRSFIATTPAAS